MKRPVFRNPSVFVAEVSSSNLFVSFLFSAQIDHNIRHGLIVFTIVVEVREL
jgi:hypothetical protein